MCGRFTSLLSPELLAVIFGLRNVPEIRPSYNIAPTQMVPVVRQASDHNSLDLLKWDWCRRGPKTRPSGAS